MAGDDTQPEQPKGVSKDMDDASLDLRDHRGRLTRLGIAAAIALVVTFIAMHWINGWSRAPNADPVGASELPLLAIGVFVVTTAFVVGVLARVWKRR